jgi:non-ribosomal peptide synthetase component F/thioesterase domain-containing protein
MKPITEFESSHRTVDTMDPIRLSENGLPPPLAEDPAQEEGVFVFPASLEQIRYWTLDQLDGDSTASNMAIAARLEGPIDDSIVERAIAAIVARHEALRTTFRIVDGQLCQVISEEATYNFTVTDLRHLPESERAAAAEAAVEEHSHARANLATGPAFFVRLVHLSDTRHFLAFTMHHIVCDGWSNGVLIRDFTDFYKAFAEDREPDLPELPFQFADFTVWQQNWLESDAATDALAWWRTQIQRGLPAVDLPTDRPRLPQKSYPGHIESTLLPASLTSSLKAYCRSHNATMHQVLLAAFQALISRYTSQHEFLLGSTIANRTQPGMEHVVGRFANPQVILADVNGNPTYSELLDRVTAWSAEAYAHQDLPFSRLMEEFQLDQAGATSQFLQVYFVYQKAFMQPQEAPGLKVIPRPSVSGGVNFDLLVSIVERAEGPRLQMEYNTVIFRKERILGLIAMYVRVLEAVMANDSLGVSELPLAEPSVPSLEDGLALSQEATPAASGLRATAPTLSNQLPAISIPEQLDRHALALADQAAVFTAESPEAVSWKTLRSLSLSLAAILRARGIEPGQTIALRMEHTVDTVVVAWALLRIGAVVLPIPTSIESAEWSSILAAHKPAFALASAAFADTRIGFTSIEVLARTVTPQPISAETFAAPEPAAPAWASFSPLSNLPGASTLETASHARTLQQLQQLAATLHLHPGDVVLAQPAQAGADAWIDFLLPLVSGATLLLTGDIAPDKFQATLDRYQAAFVLSSPQHLLAAMHAGWTGDRRIDVIVRGGVLSSPQAHRLRAVPQRLWSILSSVTAAGPFAVARITTDGIPGFQPFPGQSLSVLDENGYAAPSGVLGELSLNTAVGARLTGHLARTVDNSDGNAIEILDASGRLVRLHGYRLRLAEPEEFLWQSDSVADATAAIVSVAGTPTLVLYFQPFAPADSHARAARDGFHAVAPGHVAAAELIQVDRIPRRADGSVALDYLPAPGASQQSASSSDEYIPPRDELESRLVQVWEDVLGIRPIGIRTSFFKLGGYSLMIVRLFARINKVLGSSLPITTIFNAPTIEQLADIVRGRSYYSTLVPVQTKGSHPPFFMIHSYLLYQGIPNELGEDFPFYGLRELDTDAADMTVEQRAATCIASMRSVQPTGPYYIGGWCAAGPLAVETARQLIAAGERVHYLVLFDSWRPGYAAELAARQANNPENTFRARLDRKFRFHQSQVQSLSTLKRIRYAALVFSNKLGGLRSQFYLKNWAIAERFCNYFGLPMPHFMHNVSLTTLNSLKEYRGTEQYPGPMTLIRAKEAPYIPGAEEHCGWNSIVKGNIEVLWAPGNHETMFMPPNLQTVGEFLKQGLLQAYATDDRQSVSIS